MRRPASESGAGGRRGGGSAAPLAMIVLGPLCLLAACEVAAPEAHELFWKRVAFEDLRLGRTYETLTMFARVSDADGLEDLATLFVMNDQAQLFWRLTPQDWVIDRSGAGSGAGVWIGSTALAMPADEPVPAGVYRVIVQDVAGQIAEVSFRIAGSAGGAARQRAEAIDVTIEADELAVSGPFAAYEVWLYGDAGTRVAAAAFAERIDLESALPAETRADELLAYVYAAPPDDPAGYLSGPYVWRRS